MSAPVLRATPLNSLHRSLGAKMVDFGGWDMPVQYSGVIEEHRAVRTAVGLFDVSHMGEMAIRYYWFADGEVSGTPARIAHTGYTGEDGYEIYVPPSEAGRIWDRLMQAGAEFGIKPCGLGARNTLRLEAKMALYGHEIDASISPLEADLGWIVKLDKGDFVGRDALVKQKEAGVSRKLVGFEMRGRGIGRDGYEVYLDGAAAGWVASGGPAPSLNKNIGLCYLPVEHAVPGKTIQIMIRNQPVDAVTVETPFYKRAK